MSKNVFVYGSLMFPPVAQGVAGIAAPGFPAVLHGYSRYTVRDRERARVPAILPQPGESTRGLIYKNVSENSIDLLDQFEEVESEMYLRTQILAKLSDGQEILADTYIAGPRIRDLLSGTWDPEAFKKDELQYYLETVVQPFT
jgi:gamma-glutamylcyclotransferase (GGCT)/AIG2-like uncharacterized protein YtfP